MADQGVTGGGAVALHHVEHAGRDAGFQSQTAQLVGGQRRQLGHLQYRGVAQCQARRGLPGGGHERHVPRGNQAAYTHRLVQGVVEHLVVHRVGVTVHVGADFGEELEVVRGARDQHVLGLVDRQTGVQGLQLGQLGHVLVDQFTQLAHQLGAFLGGGVGPLREGFLGRGHGLGDFLGTAAGHFADHFAGSRVQVLEDFFALDLTAVDPMLDHCLTLTWLLRHSWQRRNRLR
ncbi:hypothetical protein D3C80_1318970 [compost metagenome]